MGSLAEQVTAELEQLSAADFVTAVTDALKRTPGARRRDQVAFLLRAVMSEEENVTALAGDARNVLDVDSVMTDIALRSAARSAVLNTPMLDSRGVGVALGMKGKNLREAASDLRRKGAVLGVKVGQRYLYPVFQFDLLERRLWPVVATVNQTLDAQNDPWAVASWWISKNPGVGWHAPMDLVGTPKQEDILAVATAS
jgi:hypothetical protein